MKCPECGGKLASVYSVQKSRFELIDRMYCLKCDKVFRFKVGVLNGKAKGKAVSVVVAFLLCGVFGGLVAQPCLAEVGDKGYFGNTATTGAAVYAGPAFFGSVFSVGVDANVTEFHIYAEPWGTGVKPAVYSLDGSVCYWHGDEQVWSGYRWSNWTGLSVQLPAGSYVLGARLESSAGIYMNVLGNGVNCSVVYGAGWSGLSWTYTNVQYSTYCNYTEVDIEGGELTASMGISSWGGLAVSVFLIAVCLVLALKSRSWAVNFLFGLGTVGFLGWVFANATVEVYGGWLMYMVLLSAVLALTKGAVLVRSSGV